MLALLLRAVNSFLWDAAVSSRETTKGKARRREVSRLSGSTCDTAKTPAPGLNEGPLTRLNRKLSFTLVLFPMCLSKGINIVSTEVSLSPFRVKYRLMIQHFLF